MRQVGFITVVILVSVAAVGYIWMNKASMPVKAGVGGGSTVFIVVGTFVVRISRTAQRRRASRGAGSASSSPLAHQQLEGGTNGKISRSNGSDSQHASNGNPYEDLDPASQS